MKKSLLSALCFLMATGLARADLFGIGRNQFEIEFVNIPGDRGDLGNWSRGKNFTFSGVNHGDYRIGTYEVTNNQWSKFLASHGTVRGYPNSGYDENPYWTASDVPTNNVSWYEAAQFVNWLNTSTGHQPAYNFNFRPGTSEYRMEVWEITDSGYDASNPFRNKNSFYFLPTENEWLKAAYWNGTSLQEYATTDGSVPTAGVDSNYNNSVGQPWNVGSGSEELNGTYDMMGNIQEWVENPLSKVIYNPNNEHPVLGGAYAFSLGLSSERLSIWDFPTEEGKHLGFRVASIPEPATLLLFGIGSVIALRNRKAN